MPTIELKDQATCTVIQTNFGFIILRDNGELSRLDPEDEIDIDIEVYGMTGYGRYELIMSCSVLADKSTLAENIESCLDDFGQLDTLKDVHIATKKALDTEWQTQWVLDNRARCVAVYRGPKQECLSSMHNDPRCVFFRSWSENTENEQPDVPEKIRGEAQRVYDALVKK